MIEKVNLTDLCLQNIVYKPEDLKRSPTTDTLSHDGHKSGTPKTNRKGEGDKERGKPAASSKSGSRQETVIHHCSGMTATMKQLQIRHYMYCIYSYLVAWGNDITVLHKSTNRQYQLKTMHCFCIYLSTHFSTVFYVRTKHCGISHVKLCKNN